MGGRVARKVALVTGAGSGIGRACIMALAAEGARVIAADLDGAAAEATAEAAREAGGAARAEAQDVSDEADWLRVLGAVRAAEGRLDVLVNNAGIGGGGRTLAETSLEQWREVQAVNAEGVFLGSRHGAALMAEGGGGSLINISSSYGLLGAPKAAPYCASKGAVTLLTKAHAIECGQAGTGVRVNSVHPGFIETALTAERFGSDKARALMMSRTPLGRLGRPEDVAACVLFLASDESAFMTGSQLVVDGGYSAI
ncbi:MAG: glucose 1-dehydrogenase [Pseudomonadota bacterium]